MRQYLTDVHTLLNNQLPWGLISTIQNDFGCSSDFSVDFTDKHIFCSFFQACNPKYPDYDKTGSICVSENINNTLTRYRWLVSAPTGPDGVTSPMREADFDTFFTSSKLITLDSVYFQPGSRVQCAARAVNSNGDEGLELSSLIVSVSIDEGECSSFSHGNGSTR